MLNINLRKVMGKLPIVHTDETIAQISEIDDVILRFRSGHPTRHYICLLRDDKSIICVLGEDSMVRTDFAWEGFMNATKTRISVAGYDWVAVRQIESYSLFPKSIQPEFVMDHARQGGIVFGVGGWIYMFFQEQLWIMTLQ